ncbi:hypothetical protein M2272_000767 [Mycobacterium frederiksbergense]|uniref:Uncharacterized protein n=1 Tax=Mycolicibacterium frederiksbergense TaxID=117567 RepID=A0ABT6KV81_9MYCO|nr:hypothetical protein [Mycolicibacterium frederiksbergense]
MTVIAGRLVVPILLVFVACAPFALTSLVTLQLAF